MARGDPVSNASSSTLLIRGDRNEPVKCIVQLVDQPGGLRDRSPMVELTEQLVTEKTGARIGAMDRY